MALEGTLNDFSPFDIMELINIKQKTGLLFVTSEAGETITLGFESNGLVLAQSSESHLDMQLGHILIKSGRLSKKHLEEALELQKGTLDRLGYILCREKYCTEEEVCLGLHIQIKRVFFNLLHWKEGLYIFEPRESIDYFHEFVKPVFVQPLSVNGLMMEGAVMIDEWPLIEKVVSSLDMVFRRLEATPPLKVATEEEAFDFIGINRKEDGQTHLNDQELLVYDLIDGKSNVTEILEQTLFSEFVVCKTLFDLAKKGLISGHMEEKAEEKIKNYKKEEIKAPPESNTQEHWDAACALVRQALPEALVLEISVPKKKITLLQGLSDGAVWIEPVYALLKEIVHDPESHMGAFEAVTNEVGLALFWDKRCDYALVVVSGLIGNSAASLFRAHMATVTRCILN